MQFDHATLERIASGEIDLAFRRWRRPSVRTGTILRTAVGEVAILEVQEIDTGGVSADDACRAGFVTIAELLTSLRPGSDRALYRVRIDFAGQDRRKALAVCGELSPEELDEAVQALRTIDARSKRGPWTQELLATIEQMPAVAARDLAAHVGRNTQKLKTDIRRLKEHGLTESLGTGYRLSPRGDRILAHLRGQAS